MEERIIKDEYGRGIRLKKTENGFVDVTDELAEDKDVEQENEAVETETSPLEGFRELTEEECSQMELPF